MGRATANVTNNNIFAGNSSVGMPKTIPITNPYMINNDGDLFFPDPRAPTTQFVRMPGGLALNSSLGDYANSNRLSMSSTTANIMYVYNSSGTVIYTCTATSPSGAGFNSYGGYVSNVYYDVVDDYYYFMIGQYYSPSNQYWYGFYRWRPGASSATMLSSATLSGSPASDTLMYHINGSIQESDNQTFYRKTPGSGAFTLIAYSIGWGYREWSIPADGTHASAVLVASYSMELVSRNYTHWSTNTHANPNGTYQDIYTYVTPTNIAVAISNNAYMLTQNSYNTTYNSFLTQKPSAVIGLLNMDNNHSASIRSPQIDTLFAADVPNPHASTFLNYSASTYWGVGTYKVHPYILGNYIGFGQVAGSLYSSSQWYRTAKRVQFMLKSEFDTFIYNLAVMHDLV